MWPKYSREQILGANLLPDVFSHGQKYDPVANLHLRCKNTQGCKLCSWTRLKSQKRDARLLWVKGLAHKTVCVIWTATWQNQQNECAQRRLRSAWASAQSDQSSLHAQCLAKGSSFLHVDSKDSDQTGRMPRLIWVFAGRTLTLLFCHVMAHILEICGVKFGLVWFLFYGPSTYFRSFWARSVNLATLFLGKPPRQFTST